MSCVRRLSGDSISYRPKFSTDRTYFDLFSPEFCERTLETFVRPHCNISTSSSTCNSDDSGIERTLNLTPTSPLPGDSDSEDSTSLDGFNITSGTQVECPLLKPIVTKLYQDIYETEQTSSPEFYVTKTEAARDVQNTTSIFTTRTSTFPNDNRFQILSYEQVNNLNTLLTEVIPIRSRNAAFPTIWVSLQQLFRAIKENLQCVGIPVREIKLNGGAASHIIGMDPTPNYNDIDVLISVDLSSHSSTIQRVKAAVLDALLRFVSDSSPMTQSQWPQPNDTCAVFVHTRDDSQSGSNKLCHRYEEQSSPTVLNATAMNSNMDRQLSDELSNASRLGRWKSDDTTVFHSDCSHKYKVTSKSDFSSKWPHSSKDSDNNIMADKNTRISATSVDNENPSPFSTPSLSLITQYPHSPSPTTSTSSSNNDMSLRESYIYKQFRKYGTQDADCWSLISLGVPSTQSKVVELKFVDRMRRQFEFTVDSFQIHLDSLLSFANQNSPDKLTFHFYPTVVAESVAGSFSAALYHLRNKLILTEKPEMIRGGGLLKYCRLLVNGYQAPEGTDVCSLERYMSSRFFIDFQDIESQKSKIEAFLANHFIENELRQKITFLKTVYRVVSGSSICLMSFERYQTLHLISQLIQQLADQLQANSTSYSLDWLACQQNLRVDKIYFGTQLFPVIERVVQNFPCPKCHSHKLDVKNKPRERSTVNTLTLNPETSSIHPGCCKVARDEVLIA